MITSTCTLSCSHTKHTVTYIFYSFYRYNRKTGYVPSMYLKLYCSPSFGLQTLQRKLHSSTINLSTINSFKLEPRVHSQNCFLKSNSLEMLSEPVQHEEAGSFSDDGTDFSFSSSDTTSMSPSMSSSEGEEGLKQQDRDRDSNDSGMSSSQSSPTSSDTYHPMKGDGAPRVPPRPQTQEILRRCTTYTRKVALATSARLATEREVMIVEWRAWKGCIWQWETLSFYTFFLIAFEYDKTVLIWVLCNPWWGYINSININQIYDI